MRNPLQGAVWEPSAARSEEDLEGGEGALDGPEEGRWQSRGRAEYVLSVHCRDGPRLAGLSTSGGREPAQPSTRKGISSRTRQVLPVRSNRSAHGPYILFCVLMPNAASALSMVSQHGPQSQPTGGTGSPLDAISLLTVALKASQSSGPSEVLLSADSHRGKATSHIALDTLSADNRELRVAVNAPGHGASSRRSSTARCLACVSLRR